MVGNYMVVFSMRSHYVLGKHKCFMVYLNVMLAYMQGHCCYQANSSL